MSCTKYKKKKKYTGKKKHFSIFRNEKNHKKKQVTVYLVFHFILPSSKFPPSTLYTVQT